MTLFNQISCTNCRTSFWPLACLLCFVNSFSLSTSYAQVANDNIENRIPVQVEQVVSSTTKECTVQRKCVREELTGKIIQYHNDQWFEFTPPEPGRYFINISDQQCQSKRGLQVVVMSGTPCEPQTYRILSCLSLSTQDDIFVTVDSLYNSQTYLINVDGYSHDLCDFQFQVSRQSKGIPVGIPISTSGHYMNGRLLEIGWLLPDSVAATYCQVWRRDTRTQYSVLVRRVKVSRNGYGQQQRRFSVLDTLPNSIIPTSFQYRIVAEKTADAPLLVARHDVVWSGLYGTFIGERWPDRVNPLPESVILPLGDFMKGADVTVELSDALTGQMATTVHLIRKKNYTEQAIFPISRFFPDGARIVLLRLKGKSSSSGETSQDIYL